MYDTANVPMAAQCEGKLARRPDITLRQNLDDQIIQAEKRVTDLKATRDRMEKSGILDARIEDIQSRQCQRRDAAKDGRLPGDDPRAPLPDYYINHLKKDKHDSR